MSSSQLKKQELPSEDLYKEPLVSICIPIYNAQKTVRDTLNSILCQTYSNMEAIVIDNASQDNTRAILESFHDPRMKVYRNTENIGAERNWSRCLEVARGKYIAIFHADDIYRPTMVEKQVRFMESNLDVGIVFTGAYQIDAQSRVIGEYSLPAGLLGKQIHYFNEVLVELLNGSNFFICPSAMVRGEIYRDLAPFRSNLFGTSADLDMWLRIIQRHPAGILSEKLMCYRISDSQGSNLYESLRTTEADFFKVMDYYLLHSKIEGLSKDALSKYKLSKLYDKHNCIIKLLIKNQPKEAKTMMRNDFFSTEAFEYLVTKSVSKSFLFLYLSVISYYVLTFLGLGVQYARFRRK